MAKAQSKSRSVSVEARAGLPAITDDPREIIESVLIKGDLSQMTPAQRTDYYMRVCQSVGLNPLTKPFEYILLNGKLTLYARRDCTDQLRSIHNVSVVSMDESDREGVHIVKCKVKNAKERTDISTGGVSIVGLKGEALANALMKAETKAKRRATLSICGLGFLDETEIADIPEASKQRVPSPSDVVEAEVVEPEKPKTPAKETTSPKKSAVPSPTETVAPTKEKPVQAASAERMAPHNLQPDENSKSFPTWADRYIRAIGQSANIEELKQWRKTNDEFLRRLEKSENNYQRVTAAEDQMADNLTARKEPGVETTEAPAAKKTKTGGDSPDPEKDPDAFVQWSIKIIATFKDYAAAVDWYEEKVTPIESKLFPPDRDEIVGALRRLEEKLAP